MPLNRGELCWRNRGFLVSDRTSLSEWSCGARTVAAHGCAAPAAYLSDVNCETSGLCLWIGRDVLGKIGGVVADAEQE